MAKKYGNEFPKIGVPAFRALASIGITNLSDLQNYSEEELLELHGFGPRALKLLREKLAEHGWSFAKK